MVEVGTLKTAGPSPSDVAALTERFLQQSVADVEITPTDGSSRAQGFPASAAVLYLSIVPEDGLLGVGLERIEEAQSEILVRGGYAPSTRQFPWLLELGIQHEVLATNTAGIWLELEPNIRMRLSEADLEECRFVAALFGEALDQAAVAVWLPGWDTPNLRGLRLVKPDDQPFTREDAEVLAVSLFGRFEIGFHLSHDRRSVEFWDYDQRGEADAREFVERVAVGVSEAGFNAEFLTIVTGSSFLVWRDDYHSQITTARMGVEMGDPLANRGYRNLIAARREIIARVRDALGPDVAL